jgi:hypothetical protein
MLVPCNICQNKFKIKPSRYKRCKFVHCSKKCDAIHKKTRYIGTSNPNRKHIYNSRFLENIDTEFKAYLLGWIASDGNISSGTISISIHNRDKEILEKIKRELGTIPIAHRKTNMVTLSICSVEWVKDVCKHRYNLRSIRVLFGFIPKTHYCL